MNKHESNKRISAVCMVLGIMLIAEIAALYMNSGVVKGVNKRADNLKVYAKVEKDDESILPGDIYDRNGNALAVTDYVDGDEKNEVKTVYSNSMAYAQLLGYTGRHVFYPLAETAEDVVGSRNDARLMAFLDENYFDEDGSIYNTVNLDGRKGESAVLTIDDGLQNHVYEAMSNYISSTDDIGSAIVMDVETGAILADVCFPTYDFNNLEEAQQKMVEDQKNTGLEPGYPVTYKNPQAPGSIFKVLVAAALIDHDMEDFTVKNTSLQMDGGWICDAYSYRTSTLDIENGDEIDLETALNISSNVYFAQAALALGEVRLNETAEKFMLTNDGDGFLLDFGEVRYNWNTDVAEDIFAQTGFGQGETEITTVQAAMIAQAVANDGNLMKPYMVDSIVDADGKTVYSGKPEKMGRATSKKASRILADYMRSTAQECCSLHGLEYEKEVFDEYGVAGKTGTAETGDADNTMNAWYISFAPYDDPRYVVVANQCKVSGKEGSDMIPIVADIYNYLFTEFEE